MAKFEEALKGLEKARRISKKKAILSTRHSRPTRRV